MMKDKIKRPTIKVGTKKNRAIIFWIIWVVGCLVAVYTNYTVTDTHTIHETKIIDKQITDTNAIENFTTNFAKTYFSWDNNQDSINKRTEALKGYITEDLSLLNADTVRTDIPTQSSVQQVHIWSVDEIDESTFNVLFSVQQTIKEEEHTKNVHTGYTTTVHVAKNGDMVIIKNPTFSSLPEKADFSLAALENDTSITSAEQKEIEEFLITFFTLYPKAEDKELTFYVRNECLRSIKQDCIFSSLINPIYRTVDEHITVDVTVEYLDNTSKMKHYTQYSLVLEKANNWQIVDVK